MKFKPALGMFTLAILAGCAKSKHAQVPLFLRMQQELPSQEDAFPSPPAKSEIAKTEPVETRAKPRPADLPPLSTAQQRMPSEDTTAAAVPTTPAEVPQIAEPIIQATPKPAPQPEIKTTPEKASPPILADADPASSGISLWTLALLPIGACCLWVIGRIASQAANKKFKGDWQ